MHCLRYYLNRVGGLSLRWRPREFTCLLTKVLALEVRSSSLFKRKVGPSGHFTSLEWPDVPADSQHAQSEESCLLYKQRSRSENQISPRQKQRLLPRSARAHAGAFRRHRKKPIRRLDDLGQGRGKPRHHNWILRVHLERPLRALDDACAYEPL